jgi:hypothetical protein
MIISGLCTRHIYSERGSSQLRSKRAWILKGCALSLYSRQAHIRLIRGTLPCTGSHREGRAMRVCASGESEEKYDYQWIVHQAYI